MKIINSIWKAKNAYLFILPLFTGLIIFSYYPALSSLYHSFFDWDILGNKEFVGFDNFKNLFKDPIFLNSIPAMLKLMIPKIIISVVVPLIFAEMIVSVKSEKLQSIYRVIVLLPMVAPAVVGTLLWKDIYDPSQGLAVELCRLFGIVAPGANVDWLGDPHTAIASIIFMGFPWVGGTAVLIYLSGIMNIPNEVREAAILDGTGTLQRIFTIDLPLIKGQIRYFIVFGIIGGLQDYSVQIILTQGGPGYTTYVPGYYMFKQAFTSGNMGYACAIGTLLFVLIATLTLITFKSLKTSD